jgi:hypothetical protein
MNTLTHPVAVAIVALATAALPVATSAADSLPLHVKAMLERSTSSPPTSTASPTGASPRTGISRTT